MDRVYYRFGYVHGAWDVFITSPETGFTDRMAFEVSEADYVGKSPQEVGEAMAKAMAMAMLAGFKHGVLVGAIAPIQEVDAELLHLQAHIPVGFKTDEKLQAGFRERHAKELAEYPATPIIDRTPCASTN